MEQRRLELLSDENGYWRQRMMMEERAATLSGLGAAAGGGGLPSSSGDSEEGGERGASSEVRTHLRACVVWAGGVLDGHEGCLLLDGGRPDHKCLVSCPGVWGAAPPNETTCGTCKQRSGVHQTVERCDLKRCSMMISMSGTPARLRGEPPALLPTRDVIQRAPTRQSPTHPCTFGQGLPCTKPCSLWPLTALPPPPVLLLHMHRTCRTPRPRVLPRLLPLRPRRAPPTTTRASSQSRTGASGSTRKPSCSPRGTRTAMRRAQPARQRRPPQDSRASGHSAAAAATAPGTPRRLRTTRSVASVAGQASRAATAPGMARPGGRRRRPLRPRPAPCGHLPGSPRQPSLRARPCQTASPRRRRLRQLPPRPRRRLCPYRCPCPLWLQRPQACPTMPSCLGTSRSSLRPRPSRSRSRPSQRRPRRRLRRRPRPLPLSRQHWRPPRHRQRLLRPGRRSR